MSVTNLLHDRFNTDFKIDWLPTTQNGNYVAMFNIKYSQADLPKSLQI